MALPLRPHHWSRTNSDSHRTISRRKKTPNNSLSWDVVLEMERELSRVREEIERMEGRLRVLADRTSLATITIRCREEKQYQPPTAPTLGSRIATAWSTSLTALRQAGENLLVAAIVLLPWAVVFGVPFLVVVWLARRAWRSRVRK